MIFLAILRFAMLELAKDIYAQLRKTVNCILNIYIFFRLRRNTQCRGLTLVATENGKYCKVCPNLECLNEHNSSNNLHGYHVFHFRNTENENVLDIFHSFNFFLCFISPRRVTV